MPNPIDSPAALPRRIRLGLLAVCGGLVVAGIVCIVVAARRLVGDEWLFDRPLASAGFLMALVGVLLPVRLRFWRRGARPSGPVASGDYTLVPMRTPMSPVRVRMIAGAIALGTVAFVTLVVLVALDVAPRSLILGAALTLVVVQQMFRGSERDRLSVHVEFEPFPFVAGAKGTVRVRLLGGVRDVALKESRQ